MTDPDLLQSIHETLRIEMERDESIVVLGEDVARFGGAFRATEGLLEQFGPQRVIDTPLSEGGAIGTALGMALYGLRPVVELSSADYLWPGFDQLIDAARMRYRSAGAYKAPLVVRLPAGGGIGAGMDQSGSPEGALAQIPGLTVLCPSDAADAAGLLRAALRAEDPVVILEPKRLYRSRRTPTGSEPVPIGRARLRREGADVTLVAWGAAVPVAEEAAARVAEAGVQTDLLDLRTLVPIDIESLLASLAKTGRVVIVAEGPRTAGFGAEIAALLADAGVLHLEAPVVRVTGPDAPVSRSFEALHLPDADRLAEALARVANF